MSRPLTVYLTIDVGPTDAILGSGSTIDAGWEATEGGAEGICDALIRTSDVLGRRVSTTWFLRADNLIERQFGDRCAIVDRFTGRIRSRLGEEAEFGWMPQLYESGPDAIVYEDLDLTYGSLESRGMAPQCVRMGNCFHDNRTIAHLDALGVRLDSSALPGRAKSDPGWRFDWSTTPDLAYRPSRADYRIPGTPTLRIVEVPLSVMEIRADYDSLPLRRYVDLCMKREYVWPNLDALIAKKPYLVVILHPDEVVSGRGSAGHPLIAYSKDELVFNLRLLVERANHMGRDIEFRRHGEFETQL